MWYVAVSLAGCEVVDIALIVDSSGSINDRDPGNWDLVKNFMKAMVDRLDIGSARVQMAIIHFSSTAVIDHDFRDPQNRVAIKSSIDSMVYLGGTTNIWHGMNRARLEVFLSNRQDRANAPNVAVIVSDGEANEKVTDTIPEAGNLKRDNVYVVTVGVTDKINEQELKDISTDNTVIQITDFDRLLQSIDSILTAACATTQGS